MTVTALIVAAGSGSRMGGDIPKQFRTLAGRSVLAHAVDALGSLRGGGAAVETAFAAIGRGSGAPGGWVGAFNVTAGDAATGGGRW